MFGPVLAIETATFTGGVALVGGEGVVAERVLNVRATYAERILPATRALLEDAGLGMSELGGLAVSLGPGSFTGLRIGLATAQGLALPTGLPLAGVSTLEALAWNLWGSADLLAPVLDARRGEVYGALYEREQDGLRTHLSPCALPPEEFARQVGERAGALGRERGVVIGPGASLLMAHLGRTAGVWQRAPAHLSFPRPASVGELGRRRLGEGNLPAPENLSPHYLRPAAAELRPPRRPEGNR